RDGVPPMKLFISGKSIDQERQPPKAKVLKNFLDQQKDGELFVVTQVASTLGCSMDYLYRLDFYTEGYHYVYRHKKYWGNPRTIKALERKDHEQRKRGNQRAAKEEDSGPGAI
ncbi:MAG: hypothetical protein OK436_06885, partial [Thaumarchaeota archaeon]|nr:hypothetical protein [Nitrososphaerota archaeon]